MSESFVNHLREDIEPTEISEDPLQWVRENAFNPAVNTALIEPRNAIANTINAISRNTVGGEPFEIYKTLEVPRVQFLSPAWLTQGISSGLAMVVPYGIAAKAAGGALRGVGARFNATGRYAELLKSHTMAVVAGAAVYDGLRVPRQGETHLGNAAGGALAFLIFEKGNAYSKNFTGSRRFQAQFFTGFAGGTAHHATAHLISSGHLPEFSQLMQAGVSGSVLNLTLPRVHEGLGWTIDSVNLKLGRGIPIDRYLARNATSGEALPRSETLQALVSEAPWVRVQDNAGRTAYIEGKGRIELARGFGDLAKLGHELDHHVQTLGTKASFEPVAKVLDNSEIAADARTEIAWGVFKSLRFQQEFSAQLAEAKIRAELAGDRTPVDAHKIAAELPGREVAPGLTYESLWRQEFNRFVESKGEVVPEVQYARAARCNPALWHQRQAQWESLGEAEKRDVVADLKFAPESARASIWRKALKDSDLNVRVEAVENLAALPSKQRMAAWSDAVHSQDYHVRLVAISRIGDLPRGERGKAWTHVIEHKAALTMPVKPGEYLGGRPVRYGRKQYDRPEVPDNAGEALKALAAKLPGEVLVEALPSLPGYERYNLWSRALTDSRTKNAAVGHIDVLPESIRYRAWGEAFKRCFASPWRSDKGMDSVVSQIRHLTGSERLDAWHRVVESKSAIGGQALKDALGSLPEPVRTGEWQSLFESTQKKPAPEEPIERPSIFAWRRRPADRSSEPPSRGLAESIEVLPEGDRYDAWRKVADAFGKDKSDELLDAIPGLPEADRLPAFKRAVEEFAPDAQAQESANYFSTWRWTYKMASIPPGEFPALLKVVLAMPESNLKAEMLTEFPLWKTGDTYDNDGNIVPGLPVPERARIAQEVFETSFRYGSDKDMGHVRALWSELPDPVNEALPDNAQVHPVRDHLVATLPAESLARLIFEPEHLDVGRTLARQNPEVVRAMAESGSYLGEAGATRALGPVVAEWINSGSLKATVEKALSTAEPRTEDYAPPTMVPEFIAALVTSGRIAQSESALALTRDVLLSESGSSNNGKANVALTLAAKLANSVGQEAFDKTFLDPVLAALQDRGRGYSWRLNTGRELAALARSGEFGDRAIKIPNLRMPSMAQLSEVEQVKARTEVEAALLESNAAVSRLLGDGTLGRLFPKVFGNHSEGGIVGRPQHGGHEFELHVHTLQVMKAVRNHPDFAKLSPKAQQNLLWAALLHDSGKKAAASDPDHEWVSANLSWGVLRSLGYPPQRVQRIADLIGRHGEMSFDPSERVSARLGDQTHLDSLAVFYRHPDAVSQLAILNEADIRSINSRSSHWTPEVQAELAAITRSVGMRARQLHQGVVPLLTTQLPQRFGLVALEGDYALLGHASWHMNDSFLRQLAVIESPEYSVSSSLLTPQHTRLYHHDASILALVAGPAEHISQAYRSNLGTGTSVDWQGHVKLASDWVEHRSGKDFLAELDARVAQSGVVGRQKGALARLARMLAEYDTLDELAADQGPKSRQYKAHQEIVKALTTDNDGKPSKEHNEIKLNNPSVVGIGVLRRGRPLYMEQFGQAKNLDSFLAEMTKPGWLVTEGDAPGNAVVIPELVWRAAMKSRLPIVVLDPNE